jgi:hypothetical protein
LTINKLVTILVPSMTNAAHQNAAAPGRLTCADLRCNSQDLELLALSIACALDERDGVHAPP